MKLKQTALVVGAGSGIGRATALELARRGYDIIAVARTRKHIQETADQVGGLGVHGLAVVADIASDESMRSLFHQVGLSSDGVHVLVNSAGTAFLGGLDSTTPEIFQQMARVNLIGPYRVIFFGRELLRAVGGHVINVASRAGRQPYPNALAYGSSKAGLVYLTRALSMALLADGIRVNAVSPGAVATRMRRQMFPDEDPKTLITAEAVASVIGLMVEPASSNLNGAVLDIPW